MQVIINQFIVCQYVHTEPFLKASLIGVPLAIILPDAKKPAFPLNVLVQLQGKRPGEAKLEVSVSSDQTRKELHRHEQKIKVADQDPRIKSGEMYSIIHAKHIGSLTFGAAGWYTFAVAIDGDVKRKIKLQVIEQRPS